MMSNRMSAHDGDCSIYASMVNQCPEDGICTCGYGHQMRRECDYSHMYSDERRFRGNQAHGGGEAVHDMTDCRGARRLYLMWVPKWASRWKRVSWAVCLGRLWIQWTPDHSNFKDVPKRPNLDRSGRVRCDGYHKEDFEPCDKCSGTGGTAPQWCPRCGGYGEVPKERKGNES
jgi:hypothetical protein